MNNKFLYKNMGGNDDVLLDALKFAFSFQQPVHLVFPRKTGFSSTDIGRLLNKLFGEETSKQLEKGENISGRLNFLLPNQINFQTGQGVILAIHCTENDMAKITSNSPNDSKIIYVSWLMEEAENWENIWRDEGLEIKYGTPNSQQIVLNQKVEEMLQRLTKIINLTTGLAHPSDKERAIKEFKNLKQLGIKENPEYIGNWALSNGWNVRHIDDLKKLATRYLA
ncbi:hypothetical protein [Alysiella crassa]|uniref:Uncharacterized protein n=1 Tax=Alysiella crassa TaxID=153491 RepID=A0A376BUR8_9NEIS|nr:hypothetical protein [Alysiella crassa]UOP06089.1 hypothetical protein LVJ80_09625 [Alysiella crassa]SSY80553.1 Uncharacterised protein [Alysiella crassa]